MRGKLVGKVAVVTGAGSGIGLATARALSSEGALVAGIDVAPIAGLDGVRAYTADVADRNEVQRAIRDACSSAGRMDILVCNAGIGAVGTVEDEAVDWRRVFEVNVFGVVETVKAGLPFLRKSSNGAIVNVASILAKTGMQNRACYAASKGAVLSLTYAMAVDCLADGIRVNCVLPGTVATPWVDRVLSESRDRDSALAELVNRQPMRRLGTAEEVASAILFLSGPDAAFVTGTALRVDGGIGSLRVSGTGLGRHQ